jgi:hypothetical protein
VVVLVLKALEIYDRQKKTKGAFAPCVTVASTRIKPEVVRVQE